MAVLLIFHLVSWQKCYVYLLSKLPKMMNVCSIFGSCTMLVHLNWNKALYSRHIINCHQIDCKLPKVPEIHWNKNQYYGYVHTKINPHTHFPIPKICMRSRRRITHKTQTFIERTHGSADTICWVGSIVLPFVNVLDKIYCTNIGIANRDVHTNNICGRCVCVR